jgi:Fe/S biogenesis protein NfuA
MAQTDTATTDPATDTTDGPADGAVERRIVDISDEALEQILDIRAAEDDADSLRLRIEVTGVNGVDYMYDLAFETEDEGKDGDILYAVGALTIVVPEESVSKLDGSVLDLPSSPMQSGLVLRNPNRPNPLAGKQLDLSGELPEKVQQLLDQSVNPSLASHGGFVELAGVEDTVVYLSMGGGCQGCAMSQATMVEGVTLAIHDAIPEVTDVIDVTDHSAGENPFYE